MLATCSVWEVVTVVSAKAPVVAIAKPAAMMNLIAFMMFPFQLRIAAISPPILAGGTKTLSSVAWRTLDAIAAPHNRAGAAIRSMLKWNGTRQGRRTEPRG